MDTPDPVNRDAWKIFLADDDDDTRVLMSSVLRRAGFEVVEASNGVELVESVTRESAPNVLVVSDVGMPELDGIAAVRALRQVRPDVPVVLVTAFGDPDTLRTARSVGVERVLAKPLDLGAFARVAAELVRAAS